MSTPSITINEVIGALKRTPSHAERKVILDAYKLAESAHQGQKRRSGEPYIQHCLATAKILARIGMDARTVAAGLMHDVPEDTNVTLNDIEKQFGADIAHMISGITKLGRIKLRHTPEEEKIENWRRMFLAMAEDVRTVVIKLADRLHNLQTLDALPTHKQQRIANETMEIYVPIANRLNMGEFYNELADLCFYYSDPENYNHTKELSNRFESEREDYVNRAINEIKKGLKEKKIPIKDIHGRAKSLYSLYRKLEKHDMNTDRIHDIVAIRVVVPSIAYCYEALGVVHTRYNPMPGRIKDYISLPKPNGYQSLHTTIFGPEGRMLEVQIRTEKMHHEAEFGIAAHWFYEETKSRRWQSYIPNVRRKKPSAAKKKEIVWIQKMHEWQKNLGNNPNEFVESLKMDFLKNHIFAFTPKGDLIELPEEATIIDFAYAIHTDIGNTATGARVDGKMTALTEHVLNGQVIEVLTDKNRPHPNPDWLAVVKTSHAKSSIRRATGTLQPSPSTAENS